MNPQRLNQLADHIEKLPPHQFSMDRWVFQDGRSYYYTPVTGHCGTTACIAGWTVIVFGDLTEKQLIAQQAAAILDLTDKERSDLFTPSRSLGKITQERAVKALRHAAETGKIRWT